VITGGDQTRAGEQTVGSMTLSLRDMSLLNSSVYLVIICFDYVF